MNSLSVSSTAQAGEGEKTNSFCNDSKWHRQPPGEISANLWGLLLEATVRLTWRWGMGTDSSAVGRTPQGTCSSPPTPSCTWGNGKAMLLSGCWGTQSPAEPSPFLPRYAIIVILWLLENQANKRLFSKLAWKILILVWGKTFEMAVRNAFAVERKDELNRASIFTVSYQDKENKRKYCFLGSIISL